MDRALFQPGLISFVGTTATDLEVGMESWGGAAAARAVLHGRAPGLPLMRTSPSGWVTAKFDAEDGFTFRFSFEFNLATPDVELHFLTRLRNDTNVLITHSTRKSCPENPKRRPTQDLRRVLLQLSLDNFPVSADRAFVHAVLPPLPVAWCAALVLEHQESQGLLSAGRTT